jgi:DNA recombination protein RmuC
MDLVAVIVGALVGAALAGLVAAQLAERARSRTVAPPGPDLAEVVEALRAERRTDLAHTVETVLALAGDKLGSQLDAGARHVDHRNELIARHLDGMVGELRRVNDAVAALQRERAEQHGQLVSGLAETARRSAEVASTAQQLREALSSPKARGQWGERMADDVLRLAGFVEGVSYVRQRALRAGTVPDFTFLLPGDLHLHMDVKFPLDNYVRHLAATSEAERAATGTQFLRDVRERVRSLAGRGYVEPGRTLDFVLLFIPNEAVYAFVHEHDPGLADLALRQNVVLCSPFTLFAVLAVVRQAGEASALQRSADDILQALGQFSVQWGKFSEGVDGLGRKLETATRAYDELAGTRRRQLQKVVDKVDELRRHHPAGQEPAPLPPPAAPLHRPGPAPTVESTDEGDVRSLVRRLTG